MHKKLTITLDENIYQGLHRKIGRGNISQFIEDLIRPQLIPTNLEAAYRQMAQDEARETEALQWLEGTSGDIAHESR